MKELTSKMKKAMYPKPENHSLDIGESSTESLWAFFRRQPAKYLISSLGIVLASLVTTFTLGYAVGGFVTSIQKEVALTQREVSYNGEVGELKSLLSGLRAELTATEKTIGFLKNEQHMQSDEQLKSLERIQTLQTTIAEKDKKLLIARGCGSLRIESNELFQRAAQLQKLYVKAEASTTKEEIEAELRLMDGKALMLKGQLDGCAACQ